MSRPATIPEAEPLRLKALRRLKVLDTLPERQFDDIARLASAICGTPISLLSLIDDDRQWFKARTGLSVQETHRDHAFCAHAILQPERTLVVNDTARDERFAHNDLVLGAPHIRFYAGAPILSLEGQALGTVCVIDTVPRALTDDQRESLEALARQAAALLELRELNRAQDAQTIALRQQMTSALVDDALPHAGLRQRQRLASLGQMTSGVAHDFNNLLQTLTGCMQLIQRKSTAPAEVTRLASSAMSTVKSAAKLTAQLLAFSKDHAPAQEPLCVAQEVAAMGELLRRAIGPGIALQFDLLATNAQTLGDPTQLEAAVLNMVINARDAMGTSGSIVLSTQLRDVAGDAELPDGKYLVLRVSDTGPGMPQEVIQRAFEPFFSTKGEGKGSGLGLAQVFGFASRAGGTARITSEQGEGTQVTLWLKPSADLVKAPVSAPARGEAHPVQGIDVLLVDDNLALLDTMGELLLDAGFSVRRASSGMDALTKIALRKPNVVMLDCAMPDMNGALLARRIRQTYASLPMVFMTGYAPSDAPLIALDEGAVLLRKPVDIEDVVEVLLNATRAVENT